MHTLRLWMCFLGYAFLLFQEESSVQALIEACMEEDGKLYLCVSSPTIKDKPVSSAAAAHSEKTQRCHYICFPEWRESGFKVEFDFQVQIRPWNLSDSDFVMDGSQPLDPRKTIFVGGVPRPLRASNYTFCFSTSFFVPVFYFGNTLDSDFWYI